MAAIILFPTHAEAAPFIERNGDVRCIISGVGMAATAATLMRLLPTLSDGDMLILAGVAGTYGRSAEVGEVVEVESETTIELPERFAQSYRPSMQLSDLRRVASNTVHGKGAAAGDAAIENMEGAAFMAACSAAGIACAEIRAVSNRVGEEFGRWRFDEAVELLGRSLESILKDKSLNDK